MRRLAAAALRRKSPYRRNVDSAGNSAVDTKEVERSGFHPVLALLERAA